METTDGTFMQLCQELAAEALAGGNAPVGAIVVYEHEVVGRGVESTVSQSCITAHAELLALQAAREQLGRTDLAGCTLYSTHEPCVMCGYAIRYHRVSRVVFGQASAYLGSSTSAFPILLTTAVPPHWSLPPQVEHFPGNPNGLKGLGMTARSGTARATCLLRSVEYHTPSIPSPLCILLSSTT